ncbi:hypothetical protein [uncultured Methanobrevibacter sp.]|uniref:hypothetical protein n=1 Tax=uncultured Methanobrevibacter sp. TaxID=253161 RepID=UPI0025D3FC37|nr:hypothetical protein [uncultured Methanobrevibacter sp.]
MNKKIITLLAVFAVVISLASVYAVETTNHDFDGLFKMNVPVDENFTNPVKEGQFSAKLSANAEYAGQNISVFYYNESNMAPDFKAENITDYLPKMLKSNSVFMDEPSIEGKVYIWNNTAGGSSDGLYLVGISSDDAKEMVCVEGNNLDDLKSFINSVEF